MDKQTNLLLNILIIIIKIPYSIFLFLGLLAGLMYAPYGYNLNLLDFIKLTLIFLHIIFIYIPRIQSRFQKIISILNLLFYLITISNLSILLKENDSNPLIYTFIILWIILFIESAINTFCLFLNKTSK